MRKQEKINIITCAILAFVLNIILICTFSYLHYKKYHYIDKGRLIAEVGDFKIYESDIMTRLSFLSKEFSKDIELEELDSDILKAMFLEKYINNQIMKLTKKNKDDEHKNKFLAREYFERLVMEDYLKNKVFAGITDEVVKAKYDELASAISEKEERNVYHILVETEEEANRIANLLKRNSKFESIARSRSIDKASAVNNGNLGYVMKEEISDENVADITFLLKLGEVSKPIETKNGWEIIKVVDIRKVEPKSFEESKDEITESIREEKYNEFLKTLNINEVEKNIKIFIKLRKRDNTQNIDNFLEDIQEENAINEEIQEETGIEEKANDKK